MSAEINIYNPEELGPPMGQYTHVTRVRAKEFCLSRECQAMPRSNTGEGDFDVPDCASVSQHRGGPHFKMRP